jgi:hypothetical protein
MNAKEIGLFTKELQFEHLSIAHAQVRPPMQLEQSEVLNESVPLHCRVVIIQIYLLR